jgi:ABC-type multidrug transport system permease subunit
MRLKLLLIASLIAAVVGSGAGVLIIIVSARSLNFDSPANQWLVRWWFPFSLYLPLLVAAGLGSMFVYRHTARRRKLQAALTLIITVLIFLGGLLAWLLLRPTFTS